jgi:low affinity Fe/Cu permease
MTLTRYAPLVLLAVLACQNVAADDSDRSQENLDEVITYLTERVAAADVTFIRNSKEHTPEEAARHMLRKYKYFKKEIKTPEDFIRLTATRSTTTDEPYLGKTKDGRMLLSSNWLHRILWEYRQSQKGP